MDRVFAMGRTYGGTRMYDTGVFKGKKAMLTFCTGGPAEAYSADPAAALGDIMGVGACHLKDKAAGVLVTTTVR